MRGQLDRHADPETVTNGDTTSQYASGESQRDPEFK